MYVGCIYVCKIHMVQRKSTTIQATCLPAMSGMQGSSGSGALLYCGGFGFWAWGLGGLGIYRFVRQPQKAVDSRLNLTFRSSFSLRTSSEIPKPLTTSAFGVFQLISAVEAFCWLSSLPKRTLLSCCSCKQRRPEATESPESFGLANHQSQRPNLTFFSADML